MESELFEYYFEDKNFHFKYAKGEPSVKDEEFHDYHEFVLFMGGNSYFLSKDIQQNLSQGSVVLIPKEHFHQFVVSAPEKYERCILGFYETDEARALVTTVMNEISVVAAPNERIRRLFGELCEVAKSELDESEKKLFIKSALPQLLLYFKHFPAEAVTENVTVSPAVRAAIEIIDEKFVEALSVSSIASSLFVSPSTLAHKFSKEMNISIYQYILKKRLISAHMRILRGESYTSAAQRSGFSDYSSFYRLYKKYYK